MKTVLAKLSGVPVKGEFVVLCYRSLRGGRTHVSHRVRGERPVIVPGDGDSEDKVMVLPADTLEDVAKALVIQADTPGTGWMREAFEIKQKGTTIVIQCTGLVQDVVFDGEIERPSRILLPGISPPPQPEPLTISIEEI